MGGRPALSDPTNSYQRGIAPNAQLFSGAIATSWPSSGFPRWTSAFNVDFGAISTIGPYRAAFNSGITGPGGTRTADVINSSYVGAPASRAPRATTFYRACSTRSSRRTREPANVGSRKHASLRRGTKSCARPRERVQRHDRRGEVARGQRPVRCAQRVQQRRSERLFRSGDSRRRCRRGAASDRHRSAGRDVCHGVLWRRNRRQWAGRFGSGERSSRRARLVLAQCMGTSFWRKPWPAEPPYCTTRPTRGWLRRPMHATHA